MVPTLAYCGAYAYMPVRALAGVLSVGDLKLMVGAFSRSKSLMESLLSDVSLVSGQSLFVRDLFEYFKTKPFDASKADALPPDSASELALSSRPSRLPTRDPTGAS